MSDWHAGFVRGARGWGAGVRALAVATARRAVIGRSPVGAAVTIRRWRGTGTVAAVWVAVAATTLLGCLVGTSPATAAEAVTISGGRISDRPLPPPPTATSSHAAPVALSAAPSPPASPGALSPSPFAPVPTAVAAIASHTAFDGLNASAALSLAGRVFGIDAPALPDPVTQSGDRLERYLATNTAVATTPTGQRVVIASPNALAAPNGSGGFTPLSLGLVDDGTHWRVARPEVATAIGKQVSDGVSFSTGFGAAPAVGDPAVAGKASGGSVFYPGVATDTDFAWRPTPQGIEGSWVLRSQNSPTDQTLQFSLPAGASLQADGTAAGTEKIVQGDAVLAAVSAPLAYDASGDPVPTSVSVSGSALTVHVDTRGNLDFPVLVDPKIQAIYGNYYGANLNIWPNWNPSNSTCMQSTEQGNLLQYQDNPAQCSLGPGGQDGWYINAPGTAYISRVDLYQVNHQPAGQSEIWGWIYGGGANAPVWTTSGTGAINPSTNCPSAGASPGVSTCGQLNYSGAWSQQNLAFCGSYAGGYDGDPNKPYDLCNMNTGGQGFEIGLDMLVAASQQTQTNYENVAGAAVTYGENQGPTTTLTGVPASGTWTTGSTVTATSTDSGLGVSEVDILESQPGTFAGATGEESYNGSNGLCSTSSTSDFTWCPSSAWQSWNTGSGPSGIWQVDGIGWNPATAGQEVGATVYVDHQYASFAPSLSASSSSPTPPPTTVNNELTLGGDGTYTLSTTATDGTIGTPLSGVRTLSYYVAGNSSTVTTACSQPNGVPAAGCYGLEQGATINTATMGPGQYSITFTATTWTGMQDSETYTFNVAPLPPPAFPANASWSAVSGPPPGVLSGSTVISDGVYNVQVSANGGTGGLALLEYQLDGGPLVTTVSPCTGPPSSGSSPCSQMTYTATIRGEDLAQGYHTITVTAWPYAESIGSTTYGFYVHHDATIPVGPGSVNAQTGAFTATANDVSLNGPGGTLAVSRSYDSRQGAAGTFALGPDWTMTLPGTTSWQGLTTVGNGDVQVNGPPGTALLFTPNNGGGYTSPEGYSDLTLSATAANSLCGNVGVGTYTLSDKTGDSTLFCQNGGTGSTTWAPTQTTTAHGSWNLFVTYNNHTTPPEPLSETIGQVATPSACQSVANSCRSLLFGYTGNKETATGTSPSQWGTYQGRLGGIEYQAYDQSGTLQTIPIEDYAYDNTGLLRAAWDPRVTPNPLKTTYSYQADAAGPDALLTTVAPPGEQPWTLTYAPISADSDPGRLARVSRFDPSPSVNATATWTMGYHVPLSGSAAPYSMTSASVANWAQSDDPGDGTAVFPPDEVPSSSPPSNYTRATIYYTDALGRLVNTALPGGRIATTEYDQYDNVVRSLTPANRQGALNAGAGSASIAEAKLLDSETTYNGATYVGQSGEATAGQTATCDAGSTAPTAGSELCDTLGPQHQVKLGNGTVTLARAHGAYTYDAGAPSDGTVYGLQTSVTTGAAVAGEADQDQRTTTNGYSGQNNLGWTQRAPTSVTTDPTGLNLTTTTVYDPATGAILEKRSPANPSGGDAHDTQTVPYQISSPVPGCSTTGALVGLPCISRPAAQPATPGLPAVPVKQITAYNIWGEPLTTTSTSGSSTRTSTETYDAAGRLQTKALTSTTGAALPTVTYGYNATTGRQTTVSTTTNSVTTTITTGYDALGRVSSYTDADGNTSTTTYDIDGRAKTTTDGKGTQTYSYDTVTGDLTTLVDSAAGTFTATYNPDATLTSETYPDGLKASYTINELGQAVGLNHVKTTNCTTNCTWLTDTITPSIYGQALTHTTTISTATGANQPFGNQSYTYDNAGRLSQVQDTAPPGLVSGQYPIPTAYSGPQALARGADGNVWFTESSSDKIGKVTPSGQITEYTTPTANSYPTGITKGPDGNVWFTESATNKIGKVTPSGTITEYALPSGGSYPQYITTGPDGNLWFTEADAQYVGKITPSGTITQYTVPGYGGGGIAAGSDGNVWFVTSNADLMSINTSTGAVTQYPVAAGSPGQLTATQGSIWFTETYPTAEIEQFSLSTHTFTAYAVPAQNSYPAMIVAGGDGSIWFTDSYAPAIGRLVPSSGKITEYPTASNSAPEGIAQGADGNIWYTDLNNNTIGVMTAPACTTRTYGYDADSNRNVQTTAPPSSTGACQTSGATTQSHTYDAADRLTDAGTTYDAFGDITTLPAVDAGGSAVTSTYYADGTPQSVTQSGVTVAYNEDPTGRTRDEITTGPTSTNLVDHYSDSSDAPAWTVDGAGNWTRDIGGISGSLAAIETNGAAPVLQLTNLQGDVIATAPASSTATTLSSQSDSSEFGVPRVTNPARYAWQGGSERPTVLSSGVVAMGARTYVPQLGRFLSPDPAGDGSNNAYTYANADPVNCGDTTGAWPQNVYVGQTYNDLSNTVAVGATVSPPDVTSPTPLTTTPAGDTPTDPPPDGTLTYGANQSAISHNNCTPENFIAQGLKCHVDLSKAFTAALANEIFSDNLSAQEAVGYAVGLACAKATAGLGPWAVAAGLTCGAVGIAIAHYGAKLFSQAAARHACVSVQFQIGAPPISFSIDGGDGCT